MLICFFQYFIGKSKICKTKIYLNLLNIKKSKKFTKIRIFLLEFLSKIFCKLTQKRIYMSNVHFKTNETLVTENLLKTTKNRIWCFKSLLLQHIVNKYVYQFLRISDNKVHTTMNILKNELDNWTASSIIKFSSTLKTPLRQRIIKEVENFAYTCSFFEPFCRWNIL